MSLLVVNYDQDLLITEAAQLNGFFKETSFSLTESNIPLQFIFNQSEFIDLLFAHAISIKYLILSFDPQWRIVFYLELFLFPFYIINIIIF